MPVHFWCMPEHQYTPKRLSDTDLYEWAEVTVPAPDQEESSAIPTDELHCIVRELMERRVATREEPGRGAIPPPHATSSSAPLDLDALAERLQSRLFPALVDSLRAIAAPYKRAPVDGPGIGSVCGNASCLKPLVPPGVEHCPGCGWPVTQEAWQKWKTRTPPSTSEHPGLKQETLGGGADYSARTAARYAQELSDIDAMLSAAGVPSMVPAPNGGKSNFTHHRVLALIDAHQEVAAKPLALVSAHVGRCFHVPAAIAAPIVPWISHLNGVPGTGNASFPDAAQVSAFLDCFRQEAATESSPMRTAKAQPGAALDLPTPPPNPQLGILVPLDVIGPVLPWLEALANGADVIIPPGPAKLRDFASALKPRPAQPVYAKAETPSAGGAMLANVTRERIRHKVRQFGSVGANLERGREDILGLVDGLHLIATSAIEAASDKNGRITALEAVATAARDMHLGVEGAQQRLEDALTALDGVK